MKKLFFLSSVLCMFIFSSCFNLKCESKKIGDIGLSSDAAEWAPYPNGGTTIFENESGDEILMTARTVTEGSWLFEEEYDTGTDFIYGEYSCYEYYEAESLSAELRSEDNQLYISHNIDIDGNNPDDLWETIRFGIGRNKSTNPNVGDWATTQGVYGYTKDEFGDIEFLEEITEKLAEVELLGMTFTDVIKCSTNDHALYLQKGNGVFAYVLDGVVWLKQ